MPNCERMSGSMARWSGPKRRWQRSDLGRERYGFGQKQIGLERQYIDDPGIHISTIDTKVLGQVIDDRHGAQTIRRHRTSAARLHLLDVVEDVNHRAHGSVRPAGSAGAHRRARARDLAPAAAGVPGSDPPLRCGGPVLQRSGGSVGDSDWNGDVAAPPGPRATEGRARLGGRRRFRTAIE